MSLPLARIIGSILLGIVMWALLRREAGIPPFWQRLSMRAAVSCLIVSTILFLGVLALRLAGWVINGDEGSVGLMWVALGFIALFGATVITRLPKVHRRWRTASLVGFVVASMVGLAVAEESVRPTSDRTAWMWFFDPPARATLNCENNSSTADLHVVIFRKTPWFPALQRRVYDEWFTVTPTAKLFDLRLDASRVPTDGTVAIIYGGSSLATVPIADESRSP